MSFNWSMIAALALLAGCASPESETPAEDAGAPEFERDAAETGAEDPDLAQTGDGEVSVEGDEGSEVPDSEPTPEEDAAPPPG